MFNTLKYFFTKPWRIRLWLFSLFLLCCFMTLFFFCRGRSQPVLFDQWVMDTIYSWHGPFLDTVFKAATFIGGPLLPFLVVGMAAVLFFVFKKRVATFYYLGANIFNAALIVVFKFFGKRARPEDSLDLASTTNNYSFLSGHTAASVMFFGGLFWLTPYMNRNIWVQLCIRLACTILLVLVPLSRVYLHAHYPTDVLGGILLALGVLAGLLFIFYLTYKGEKNA